MNITHASITRTTVTVDWETDQGHHNIGLSDAPLPAFPKALQALAPLVCAIIHAPDTYTEGLKVVGIKMDEQGGSPTVSIVAQKNFDDAAKAMKIETPPRLLAHPKDPGTYTPPLSDAQKTLVDEVIECAKAYARGERAQGTLPLETPEDKAQSEAAEPREGDVLDFKSGAKPADDGEGTPPAPPAEEPKKRGRNSSK